MACRIGSIYINLILIGLEDTILQALGFDSICIDPILHGISHVILDPNEIQSYMAYRIGSICKSDISSEMNIQLYMHKDSILPIKI
jgi:hypothetical protein